MISTFLMTLFLEICNMLLRKIIENKKNPFSLLTSISTTMTLTSHYEVSNISNEN